MKFKGKLRTLCGGALIAACSLSAWSATPKYVFYFIGDGMGVSPAMAAVTYARNVLGQDELPLMLTFPHAGWVTTYSASSDVTDSAAAGTALATGHKTKNSMLGMSADTVPVYSIAKTFKDAGYGIGLVTNVAADDATPGAFYAHVANRGMAEQIDRQFIPSGVDFLAGSGLNGLERKGESTGVKEEYEKNNIKIIHSPKDVDLSKRIVLLQENPFQRGNTGYMIDSIPGMMTLPEMTQACLDYLVKKSPDNFFMMVEGGNIDHALHGNDALTTITEIYNFNNALELAYKFLQERPEETLIVVTADHDTGGISVGNNITGYQAFFDVLSHQKMSKEMFSDVCKKILKDGAPGGWPAMQQLLAEKFGLGKEVKLTDAEMGALEKLYKQVFVEQNSENEKSLYNDFNAFASAVFRTISNKAGVGWTTGAHTGNPVGVYAVGAGAENFSKIFDNTEIPSLILKTAGFEKK